MPDSGMSAASRSHYMNGNATIIAGQKLMDAMRKKTERSEPTTKWYKKASQPNTKGIYEHRDSRIEPS
jgi:aldehyde oxidoreductase